MSDELWTGHPWSTAEHRPLNRYQSSCSGCGQKCSRTYGCCCCSEPAYEWLLEEARQTAADTLLTLAAGIAARLENVEQLFPWEKSGD